MSFLEFYFCCGIPHVEIPGFSGSHYNGSRAYAHIVFHLLILQDRGFESEEIAVTNRHKTGDICVWHY